LLSIPFVIALADDSTGNNSSHNFFLPRRESFFFVSFVFISDYLTWTLTLSLSISFLAFIFDTVEEEEREENAIESFVFIAASLCMLVSFLSSHDTVCGALFTCWFAYFSLFSAPQFNNCKQILHKWPSNRAIINNIFPIADCVIFVCLSTVYCDDKK
jgi:hypothetical protein